MADKKVIKPGPFVVPMPTVLVGAKVGEKPNYMPAAFLGIVNYKPPVIACGLNPKHHTCDGIVENGTFSVNLPPSDQVVPTDWCGLKSGADVDKSGVFESFYGELVSAPMARECRLTAECKLVKTVELEVDTVYFGEVVAVHVDEDALADGKPDWKKIDPLIFTFPDRSYWKLGQYVAPAWKAGKEFESGSDD